MRAETRIKDMEEIIKYSIEKDLKKPIMIYGKVGIGKSETIKRVASELNIGFIDMRVLLYSEVELKGIPFPNEDKTATVWLKNNILPEESRDGSRGILLLDELPAAKPSVMTALYQLCLDRKLGEYSLPDGWHIIATGNREEDKGVYYDMPPALSDRFVKFVMETSAEDWLNLYAYKNRVHYLVTSFISFAPERIHTYNPELQMTSDYFATPRTWVTVSDILKTVDEDSLLSNKVVWQLIHGNLDDISFSMFSEFCKVREEIPDLNRIFRGERLELPDGEDKKHMIIGSLSHMIYKMMIEDFIRSDSLELSKSTIEKIENAFSFVLEKLSPSNKGKFLKDLSLKDSRISQYFKRNDFPGYDDIIDSIMEVMEGDS